MTDLPRSTRDDHRRSLNRRQALQLLHKALRADPLAKAHGYEESAVLLGTNRALGILGTEALSIVWEGGPYEWAIALPGGDSLDSDYRADLGSGIREALDLIRREGYYVEAANSYALSIYSA